MPCDGALERTWMFLFSQISVVLQHTISPYKYYDIQAYSLMQVLAMRSMIYKKGHDNCSLGSNSLYISFQSSWKIGMDIYLQDDFDRWSSLLPLKRKIFWASSRLEFTLNKNREILRKRGWSEKKNWTLILRQASAEETGGRNILCKKFGHVLGSNGFLRTNFYYANMSCIVCRSLCQLRGHRAHLFRAP